MKKILFWETLSIISGGQRMTLTILDMLKEKYEIHCLIPGKGALSEELDRCDISYTIMGDQSMPTGMKGKSVIFKYGWLSIKATRKAVGVIRREKPDLIYAAGPAALPWSAFCGWLTKKPVIWHLHHIFLDGATKKLLNLCSAWKSVKKIISVSNCVGAQITNEYAQHKIITIYNPVKADKYVNGDGEKVIKELGIEVKKDKIMIGHIALLQASKRQDIVVKTVKELRERGYDACALLVGRARDGEVDYVDSLQMLVSELDLNDHIFFLGHRNDIADILKSIHVLMIPSSFEGFPLAGLEACAAGVPVIAADLGGSREFIEVSNSGLIFEYENEKIAADKVIEICDINKLQSFRENGLMFAWECSIEAYKEKVKSIFGEVV